MKSDAARELAAASHAVQQARAQKRRDQVSILKLVNPRMSAEEMAVMLKVSLSTIRADWRVLKQPREP